MYRKPISLVKYTQSLEPLLWLICSTHKLIFNVLLVSMQYLYSLLYLLAPSCFCCLLLKFSYTSCVHKIIFERLTSLYEDT